MTLSQRFDRFIGMKFLVVVVAVVLMVLLGSAPAIGSPQTVDLNPLSLHGGQGVFKPSGSFKPGSGDDAYKFRDDLSYRKQTGFLGGFEILLADRLTLYGQVAEYEFSGSHDGSVISPSRFGGKTFTGNFKSNVTMDVYDVDLRYRMPGQLPGGYADLVLANRMIYFDGTYESNTTTTEATQTYRTMVPAVGFHVVEKMNASWYSLVQFLFMNTSEGGIKRYTHDSYFGLGWGYGQELQFLLVRRDYRFHYESDNRLMKVRSVGTEASVLLRF